MPTRPPTGTQTRAILTTTLATCLCGCSPLSSGFLNPAGPVASAQRDLLFWIVGVSMVVVLPVLVLTPWLLWRYRFGQQQAPYRPRWEFSLPLEILSWGVPVLVVIGLGALTWGRTHQLDPYQPLPDSGPSLKVQVIALDWKWLFIYPEQGVATVNELVIPSGRSVHLSLTSATVMQSLMIPRLAGQIYAMAGMRTQQYLQSDAVGEFTGRNTQFNGVGFQQQRFITRSLAPEAFDQWLDTTRQANATLDCAAYLHLSQNPSQVPPSLYRSVQPGLFEWVMRSFHGGTPRTCDGPIQGKSDE
jgi:cytochrome o ubiquinol oxidase subunit 2